MFALFAFMYLPQFTLEFGANLSFKTSKHWAGRAFGDLGTIIWHKIHISSGDSIHPVESRAPVQQHGGSMLSNPNNFSPSSFFINSWWITKHTKACCETPELWCMGQLLPSSSHPHWAILDSQHNLSGPEGTTVSLPPLVITSSKPHHCSVVTTFYVARKVEALFNSNLSFEQHTKRLVQSCFYHVKYLKIQRSLTFKDTDHFTCCYLLTCWFM